jgi:pyruvate,water dikinase
MDPKATERRAQQKQESAKPRDFQYIRWFETLGRQDVPLVGGKNASLGEMIQNLGGMGIRIPGGFATTADAYRAFVQQNQLAAFLQEQLKVLKAEKSPRKSPLEEVGQAIRTRFLASTLPPTLVKELREAYRALSQRYQQPNVDVAVRSSATAEDLPEASFAGQQESYLNISGEDALLEACRQCFASLFTDRAIAYREKHGFEHDQVALSVGVQKMVRADEAGAGVMFSIDTETGFPNAVLINAGWGLGDSVVQGTITPDEYTVFKPTLKDTSCIPILEKLLGSKSHKTVYAETAGQHTQSVPTRPEEQTSFVLQDTEILQLARWAVAIEAHYGCPMDMEWAKDGSTQELFIVQARPETVQSQKSLTTLKTYTLDTHDSALLSGVGIGESIATGPVRIIHNKEEINHFQPGDVLVTEMTEPDWVPIFKKAAAIVTDTGGRTSHAAIVSREYGIPAIVGTQNATKLLKNNQIVTVSCAEGDQGLVYDGEIPFSVEESDLQDLPTPRTAVMVNIASPAMAFHWWRLPVQGIGLARIEFIISNTIQVHPMALLRYHELTDPRLKEEIDTLTHAYLEKPQYFVDLLAQGIGKIAASQWPKPVIVRTSDFKTNEYASLLGGEWFEPQESNPMLGFRGTSRYYDKRYQAAFALECQALLKARQVMGLHNIIVMLPFCRTVSEADQVLAIMAEYGLKRGAEGLEIYVMAELPSNILLAEAFAQRFDGFSIGSNDLTQLTLGIDRDSPLLAPLFNEADPAVQKLITMLIDTAHQTGTKVGLCGQAPSDNPAFAEFLVKAGIDAISLNPDRVLPTLLQIAEIEERLRTENKRPENNYMEDTPP